MLSGVTRVPRVGGRLRLRARPYRSLVPILPMVRAVPALLGIFPWLDFAAA
jgi:hypothetical protein